LQANSEKYILIHILTKVELQQLREVVREEVKAETEALETRIATGGVEDRNC